MTQAKNAELLQRLSDVREELVDIAKHFPYLTTRLVEIQAQIARLEVHMDKNFEHG